MKNDFLIAITQLCAEKNLRKEVVFEAIEAALASAYRRNFGDTRNVTVKILPSTGEVRVFAQKEVVETVADSRAEVSLGEARRVKPDATIGDLVEVESTTQDFGRIAAQTAKQVVLQRLREAEREAVFGEFSDKEGDIVSGVIQRIEPRRLSIDLGKTEAILPEQEQVAAERYRPGQRIKAYLLEVRRGPRGPEVVVSRTHKNLLRRLFELEVPEIYNGAAEIKAIAREAGSRSKVAVVARQEGLDPIGACVGLRGIRIQNIVNELSGEKIDVVQWHPDPGIFVANALSPAQVVNVEVDEAVKTATVTVPDRQLSLAIGKEGQNARLAAKLTGWRIDIKSATQARAEAAERAARREAEAMAVKPPAPTPVEVPTPPVVEAPPPVPEVPAYAEASPGPAAVEAIPVEVPAVVEPPLAIEVPAVVEPPAFQPEPAVAAAPPGEAEFPFEAPGEFSFEPLPEPTGVAERGQLRFAEDIFDTDFRDGKKKAKGKRGLAVVADREREPGAKPKKKHRGRPFEQPDEGEDQYAEFMEKFKK